MIAYLFLLLMAVNSQQTYPYVSFMSQTLANHSYADITTVGDNDTHSVKCITDLSTCCSGAQGSHRGDWYFPNGTRLQFVGSIREHRTSQRVYLACDSIASKPTGIYHCSVATNEIHDVNHIVRDHFYIGLYTPSGGYVTIQDEMSFNNDQITLTCISTGGPATTVTWSRNYSTILTEGTETVLNDPVTATYTHTLSVGTSGHYTCTVSNNKPSEDSTSITLEDATPPTNLVAVQSSATSITVTWTPPSPLGNTTGYRLLYTSGEGNSRIFSLMHSSASYYTWSHLTNGEIYHVSVSSVSSRGVSVVSTITIPLVPLSIVTLDTSQNVTATTITITVSLSDTGDSVVTGYVVEWTRDTSIGCSDRNQSTITETGSFTSYTITGLEPGNRYTVTVRLSNDAGNGPASNNITETTLSRAPTGAPTSFRAGAVTSNSVIVHWDEVPCLDRNGDVQYIITISNDGENLTLTTNTRHTTFSALSPLSEYIIEIRARNDAGTGPSEYITVLTTDELDLFTTNSSPISITLSWRLDNRTTATASTISYYNINTECLNDSATIITVPKTPYILTGLQEGSQYSVTVTATVPGGIEEATITPTTMTDVAAAPPSNVRVIGVTSSTITVQWEPVEPCRDRNGEITGYSVRYDNMILEVSGDLSGGNTTISGLSPSTTYSIQVAAVNSAGTGVYSDSIDVTTLSSVYLTLNGEVIPNHGYVLISDIGSTDDTALLCHTNNPPSPGETNSGGDWFYPNGTAVDSTSSSLERNRASMLVRLRRSGDTSKQGIYWCRVKDAMNISWITYIGLYHETGGIAAIHSLVFIIGLVPDHMLLHYTLTCISSGGPTTTVTWTRGSTILTEGIETVLNDPVTATYTHTLTMNDRLPGLYTCAVENGRPSNNSSSLFASQASPPTNVVAVQSSATSITVTWTPPSPLGNTTGYNITITGEGESASEHVQSGSATSYELSGLQNGVTYTLSIIATSAYFPSNDITVGLVTLIQAPGEVIVEVDSITATSISLSWSVASGSVSSWEVVWRETDRGTESSSGSLSGTSYTIDQLNSTTFYTVTVTATNVAGNTTSIPLLISTISIIVSSDGSSDSNAQVIIAVTVIAVLVAIGSIALTVAVILRSHYKTNLTNKTSGCETASVTSQPAVELTQLTQPLYEDPNLLKSNKAYNAITWTTKGPVDSAMYCIVPQCSSTPVLSDNDYELKSSTSLTTYERVDSGAYYTIPQSSSTPVLADKDYELNSPTSLTTYEPVDSRAYYTIPQSSSTPALSDNDYELKSPTSLPTNEPVDSGAYTVPQCPPIPALSDKDSELKSPTPLTTNEPVDSGGYYTVPQCPPTPAPSDKDSILKSILKSTAPLTTNKPVDSEGYYTVPQCPPIPAPPNIDSEIKSPIP